MLDLKFVAQHPEQVQRNIEQRFLARAPRVSELLALYEQHHALKMAVESLRQQRNANAASAKKLGAMQPEERERAKVEITEQGKQIKVQLTEKEAEYQKLDEKLQEQSRLLPNMSHPDAPIGKEEGENKELYRVGQIPEFALAPVPSVPFVPKGHLELMENLDLIDFESGAKVTGAKHYYLKNDAVFLELALTRFAADTLKRHGFSMCITPDLAREEILQGIGFQPRGAESNTYTLEEGNLCLIGTAEITLGGMYSGQILDLSEKPVLLGGLSHCFRKEAGAAGQYSKGLYRVHQFSKVEMFILCQPKDSEAMHQKLLEIEEEIFAALEIPYRVLDICTGDLGAPAYRKYDLEAWMPGRGDSAAEQKQEAKKDKQKTYGDWGEVTSASNCTDYQARRLGIRYRDPEGKTAFVHTLNGTALALSRAIIALLENHQRADGSIGIPKALQPYMGCSEISAQAGA